MTKITMDQLMTMVQKNEDFEAFVKIDGQLIKIDQNQPDEMEQLVIMADKIYINK